MDDFKWFDHPNLIDDLLTYKITLEGYAHTYYLPTILEELLDDLKRLHKIASEPYCDCDLEGITNYWGYCGRCHKPYVCEGCKDAHATTQSYNNFDVYFALCESCKSLWSVKWAKQLDIFNKMRICTCRELVTSDSFDMRKKEFRCFKCDNLVPCSLCEKPSCTYKFGALALSECIHFCKEHIK